MKQYIDLLKNVYSRDINKVESAIDLVMRELKNNTISCYESHNGFEFYFQLYSTNDQNSLAEQSLKVLLSNLLKKAQRNLKKLIKDRYSNRIIDLRTNIRSFGNKIMRRNTEEDVISISNILNFSNSIHEPSIYRNGSRKFRNYQ